MGYSRLCVEVGMEGWKVYLCGNGGGCVSESKTRRRTQAKLKGAHDLGETKAT